MPYIPQDRRIELDFLIEDLNAEIKNWGELNYVITRVLGGFHPSSYQDYMALIGSLEMVKLEYYRKMAVPYEDKRCEENGDVY